MLLALIVAVLLIRDPAQKLAPASQKVETHAPTATPAPLTPPEKPKTMDDSHKKVAGIIDDASSAIVKEAPGLWARMQDSWNWMMGFDAKHAIILIVVVLLAVGVIVNQAAGGNKNTRKQR